MQQKEYSLHSLSTNVRILIEQARDKLKSMISEYTRVYLQEHDSAHRSLKNNKKKKRDAGNPEFNPFQEDNLRTDFLTRWVEKVNLDIFDHFF